MARREMKFARSAWPIRIFQMMSRFLLLESRWMRANLGSTWHIFIVCVFIVQAMSLSKNNSLHMDLHAADLLPPNFQI
jgi:hypothetical protein